MDKLEAIREKISDCDNAIIEQLVQRMNCVKEIIAYKKEAEIPILQPEQERKQLSMVLSKLKSHEFEAEIVDIFENITKNSRRIQAKSLFNYNIFLVGFMGSGKSTVAGKLSQLLEMDRVEVDALIAEKQKMPVPEIFEQYGETYFRNLESNVLIELQKRDPAIVSCGGGVVIRSENADHMKKHGKVVLLTATPETIYFRVKDGGERPLLKGNMNVDYISKMMEGRWEKYESIADIVVDTNHRSTVEICEEIIAKLIALDKMEEAGANLPRQKKQNKAEQPPEEK